MDNSEHHMPDVDASKISLLPRSNTSRSSDSQAGFTSGFDALHGCHAPAETDYATSRAKQKRKQVNDSLIGALCQWTVRHQIGISINLVLLHALAHICFPRARQTTSKFYQLSNFDRTTGKYAAGWDDLYLVLYSIVALTGLRAATMDYILAPLAQALGIHKKKERTRFAEQAWIVMYGSVFWSLGMFIMYNSEHWMNYRELWTNWPDREVTQAMKWYYLVQFSFWLQQIFIVNIEERRKDHWQMFTHHVVTCVLMFWSYGYHFTKAGNLILCLMDIVDIIFGIAKILKYLKYQTACDVAFGVFMVVWFAVRHVLYLGIVYSILRDVYPGGTIPYGCFTGGGNDIHGPSHPPNPRLYLFEPFRDPTGMLCFSDDIKYGFIYVLMSLQVILLIWFGMIIRVAIRVLKGAGADDSRSDDEDEGEEDDEELVQQNGQMTKPEKDTISEPYEEEVDAEDMDYLKSRSSPARRYRKTAGRSSGVSLGSDRKELLGRIGCDGGSDD